MTVAEAWAARIGGGRSAPLAKALFVWGGPLALLLLGMLLGLSVGAVNLGLPRVFDGLMDRGDTLARTIVWDLRLPRVLLAALVGASLGVSGGLLQGVTRNPLADPHILGLTAGGGLAAAIAIRVSQDFPQGFIPPIAFGGSMIGAAVVYTTSWRGGASPLRLALAGVAVAALLTSGTTMVLVTSNLFTQAALAWLAGGLFGRGWEELQAVWPFAIVGIGAAILLSRSMNVLALGDEAAQSLGLDVERTRFLAIGIAALLAGAAVAAAGMVAFVGLVIPHISRFLTGDDHRRLLPLSVVLGASLVVYADVFARVVQAPVEIPMGIVTAAIGAPFLLYLIRART